MELFWMLLTKTKSNTLQYLLRLLECNLHYTKILEFYY